VKREKTRGLAADIVPLLQAEDYNSQEAIINTREAFAT
jgi:hypothetical protein